MYDFRQAARTLFKTPGFALTVIIVLALGIGANTAIFSILNSILLHPAGISDPGRIAVLRVKYDKLNLKSIGTSAPDFADMRDSRQLFSAAAAMSGGDFNYTGSDLPVRLQGAQVTWQFFDVFGVKPRTGRMFRSDEDAPGMNRVVVLSDAVWKRVFGADAGIVGRKIQLNQEPYQVVGIMGSDFRFPALADLWTPLAIDPKRFTPDNRGNQWLFTAGRLRPGVSLRQAASAIKVLEQQIIQREDKDGDAKNSGWGIFLVPFLQFAAGDSRTPLLILMGAVGLVLLIACSNIAGLMLARASYRAREYSVRVALGAGTWRIVRQTLAESLTLSAAGAFLGMLAGIAGSQFLVALAPSRFAEGVIIRTDYRVLLFTMAAAALAAVLFGIAPALQLARTDHQLALREGGRGGTASKARQRVRSALVVAEVALALVLMVGAGLLVRSLVRMHDVSTGFDPSGVMTAQLSLPRAAYKEPEKQISFYRAAIDRLHMMPGVQRAAAVIPLPFSGDNSSASFNIARHPAGPGQPEPHGDVRLVTPEYFEMMRMPLIRGRYFNETDRAGSERGAIIDEMLAKQYWPNEDPVGQQIYRNPKEPATIVGIVGHVRHSDLTGEDKKGAYYYPMLQVPEPMAAIVVRSAGGDPAGLAGPIREAIRAVDPAQPVHSLKTMEDLVEGSLAGKRLAVILLGVFAGFALVLSAVGIYGVISYSVTQRTAEIGIRMALGANRGNVLGLVVGQGAVLAGLGVALGVPASLALVRVIQSELFNTSAFDPATLVATAAVLLAVALLAAYLPAHRAMRIDPADALRYE